MGMSTLICVLTILIMKLHFKDSKSQVSGKAVVILNVLRLQFLCRKRKQTSTVGDKTELDEIPKKNMTDGDRLGNNNANKYSSWKAVAEGYDQVMMYYFYIIIFLQWFIYIAILTP
jgi:hypothetical protein